MGCSGSTPADDQETPKSSLQRRPPTSSGTFARQTGDGAPPSSQTLRLQQVRGFGPTASPDYDYLFRVMILGDSGVGKSSVSVAYTSGKAPGNLPATVGVDILVKNIVVNGKRLRLQLFDPAGHERNWIRASNSGLWRSANATILMFDVTANISFANIQIWLNSVKETLKPTVPLVLVGNKIDREEERSVSRQEAEDFARANSLAYFETSAATSVGIEELFDTIGNLLTGPAPK